MKINIQLPAVVREATKDARRWFKQVEVDDLDILKIEAEEQDADTIWVGLTFERGMRFYVTYQKVDGDIHNFFQPMFVQLWDRKARGSDGEPSKWEKWQWLNGEEGLTKVA
jgi:hypothetical protein